MPYVIKTAKHKSLSNQVRIIDGGSLEVNGAHAGKNGNIYPVWEKGSAGGGGGIVDILANKVFISTGSILLMPGNSTGCSNQTTASPGFLTIRGMLKSIIEFINCTESLLSLKLWRTWMSSNPFFKNKIYDFYILLEAQTMINPFLIVDVYLRMPFYHTQLIYICGIFSSADYSCNLRISWKNIPVFPVDPAGFTWTNTTTQTLLPSSSIPCSNYVPRKTRPSVKITTTDNPIIATSSLLARRESSITASIKNISKRQSGMRTSSPGVRTSFSRNGISSTKRIQCSTNFKPLTATLSTGEYLDPFKVHAR